MLHETNLTREMKIDDMLSFETILPDCTKTMLSSSTCARNSMSDQGDSPKANNGLFALCNDVLGTIFHLQTRRTAILLAAESNTFPCTVAMLSPSSAQGTRFPQ